MRRAFGLFTGVLSFLYLIFVLNSIQTLSVILYPFSKKAFREVNRWCARSCWGLWVLMGEVQNDIEVRFVGDEIVPRENALVLLNHQSMADCMVAMCFAWRCGRVGDMKWFVKDVIKYFPGFGWGMKFLDCIFVKRDWARDKDSIHRLFDKYKAENIPIFLISFLEGTRKTNAKLQAAQAFAEERGLYVPQATLVPRTKGFVATMNGLRGHLDAVYDLTVGYADFTPTLVNCFESKVKRIEIKVQRFPMSEMPGNDEALSEWAYERFREKDETLIQFAEENRLQGREVGGPVRIVDWFVPEARRAVSS